MLLRPHTYCEVLGVCHTRPGNDSRLLQPVCIHVTVMHNGGRNPSMGGATRVSILTYRLNDVWLVLATMCASHTQFAIFLCTSCGCSAPGWRVQRQDASVRGGSPRTAMVVIAGQLKQG